MGYIFKTECQCEELDEFSSEYGLFEGIREGGIELPGFISHGIS